MNLKIALKHKVIKACSWYTITNFFLKGIGFLTIPIFTRLLTTEDYGIISLYSTWVSIFTTIITLGLINSIGMAKFDFKNEYNQFASSILFLSLLVFVSFLGIFMIFDNVFQGLTGLTKELLFFMFFQAYFLFVKNFTISKFRFEYKYKLVSVISILTSIAAVFLSIFLITNVYYKEEKFLGRIIGDGSLIILFGSISFCYLLFKGRKLVNFKYWRYALVYSVPLVLHSLSNVVNAQFDRIVINRYIGDSSTGIYSFAYNIGMIILVLWSSLEQAWTPWLFEKLDTNNYRIIRKLSIYYRDFFTFVYSILLMISPELVKLMADKSYWEGLYIIPWVFMGYYFNFMTSFEVKIERFYKKTKWISIGTMLGAGINIVLNIFLIPIYGYAAAAITTVITFLLIFIFHYMLTSKVIKHTVYGFKFHLKSIVYVSVITIYFIIFQDMILFRILGILSTIVLFYKTIRTFLDRK